MRNVYETLWRRTIYRDYDKRKIEIIIIFIPISQYHLIHSIFPWRHSHMLFKTSAKI